MILDSGNPPQNWTVTILASVVTAAFVSALVAGFFALVSQRLERKARRRELIFTQSMELAKLNRDFVLRVAQDLGAHARIHDYAVYAEMYYWLINELYEEGRLPEDWRREIKRKFPDVQDPSR